MKKVIIALITLAFTSTSSIAGPKIEVLHWWTSGGEAAALKVLKDDFAANGGEWLDMPVTGGGGDAANVALKARIVAGDCLLYTSPSPRDRTRSRMPSSA